MERRTRVSNAQIIAALLECSTDGDAANSLGISKVTVARRKRSADFQREYHEAINDALQAATGAAQARLRAAVDVLSECMENSANPPQVRVNAANSLLDRGLRLIEVNDILPRLEALERVGDA